MERSEIAKKVDEFLEIEKSGEGANLGKVFRKNLTNFIADLVYAQVVGAVMASPMKESVPEADASVATKFKHRTGSNVYYILFKKVKVQKKNTLQVQFGWQYDVLFGKVEEIQVRADNGIIYKVNGDYVLQDFTFADEVEAQQRCNELNAGTVGAVLFDVPNRETPLEITKDTDIDELFIDAKDVKKIELTDEVPDGEDIEGGVTIEGSSPAVDEFIEELKEKQPKEEKPKQQRASRKKAVEE